MRSKLIECDRPVTIGMHQTDTENAEGGLHFAGDLRRGRVLNRVEMSRMASTREGLVLVGVGDGCTCPLRPWKLGAEPAARRVVQQRQTKGVVEMFEKDRSLIQPGPPLLGQIARSHGRPCAVRHQGQVHFQELRMCAPQANGDELV